MDRLNRTRRILLAALVAVVATASINADSVVIRARAILDSGIAIATHVIEPFRATADPAAAVASFQESAEINGAVDTDGDGVADASSDIGVAAATIPGDSAAAVTECGAAGQRACCSGEKYLFQNCDDGKAEIPGCEGDCTCEDGRTSSGTCIEVTACGDQGQRACILGERLGGECNEGLTPLPGCSGDCFGKGVGSSYGRSMYTCAKLKDGHGFYEIEEPGTNADLSGATTSCTMSGYADLHLHLFADMAHGGAVLAGKVYEPELGINEALKQDFTTGRTLVKDKSNAEVTRNPIGCPGWFTAAECSGWFFHGDHDLVAGDTVGDGTKDGAAISSFSFIVSSNLGAPIFNGWPKWTSTTHQQAYYRWLKRAWQGGLRLVTMLAVTNEALCKTGKRNDDVTWEECEDSMASIREQIDATKSFANWIKANDGDWFRIALTPLDARIAIAEGKLAVVLGVETAELFNCKFPIDQCEMLTIVNDTGYIDPAKGCSFERASNGRDGLALCTPQKIMDEVKALDEMGVRHVFPVHNFDNAFGGAASWMNTIEVGNRIVEDHWWRTRDCSAEGYELTLGGVFTPLYKLLLTFIGGGIVELGPPRSDKAGCNYYGLLPQGRVLIEELMKKGMIIDVDHMSVNAFDTTLFMAEHASTITDADLKLVLPGRDTPYPVVASHVQSRDMHEGGILHERMRTKEQLLRIKGVKGMIAAMLKDDQQDTDNKGQNFMTQHSSPEGSVNNSCRHSSKSFANAYQYAVDTMDAPVAFGSDFNGVAGHIGPRFGSEACGGWPEATKFDPFPAEVGERQGERSKQYRQGKWLTDPFTVEAPGHFFGTFYHQQTGFKVFDFNRDGLAHIGLLPDFVADLKNVGLPDSQYNRIFKSAEEYIKVWERARGETSPTDTCELVSGPAFHLEAAPAITFEGIETTFRFTVRNKWEVETVCGPSGQVYSQSLVKISAGELESTYEATCVWKGGNWDPQIGTLEVTTTFDTTVIKNEVTIPVHDGVLPTVTCHPDLTWHRENFDVAASCVAKDKDGNSLLLPRLLTSVAEGTETANATTDTGSVCDKYDVCADVGPFTGIKVDRKAPAVSCGASDGLWHPADVNIGCLATDGGSGLAGPADASFALSTSVLVGSETANALTGSRIVCDSTKNCASAGPIGGNMVDKKAPSILVSRIPPANAAGWNNTDVVATFVATDGGSGVHGAATLTVTFTTEGANQSATRTFSDNVGNAASASIGNINIDKTPPTLTCSNNGATLWPPDHKLVTVTAAVKVDGGISGASGFTLRSATSNEPDNGLGDGDTEYDIQGWSLMTPDTSGMFRAERSGKGTGRIYTLTYQGLDLAGNAGMCTTRVSVVHDNGGKK